MDLAPPPAPQSQPPKSNRTGPLTLVAVQQPIETFHKDEGGKSNQLQFRVLLQGELTPELAAYPSDQIPLEIKALFEDGGVIPSDDVLEIMGCTERANSVPSVSRTSRLGGVSYRFNQVSKRHGDKRFSIQVSLQGFPQIGSLKSVGTMVFSKRKNVSARVSAQEKEKQELEARERAAMALLEQTAYSPVQGLPPAESPRLPKRFKPEMTLPKRIKIMEDLLKKQTERIDKLEKALSTGSTTQTTITLTTPSNGLFGLSSPLPDMPMPPSAGRSESAAYWEARGDTPLIHFNPGPLKRGTSEGSFSMYDEPPKL